MKQLLIGLVVLAWMSVAAGCQSTRVSWVCTTANEPWKEQAELRLDAGITGEPDVVIETRQPLQVMDGFGGCFNELGWEVLLALPESERAKVMSALFGDEGCGFTLARMPIGASDYGREWYSLDDTPGDLALEHFSIDRDKGYLLKYVKEAMAVRPELGVFISAWSPPAWMKDNNSYSRGRLKTDAATRKAYAMYLAKAVQAYQGEGLNVYACMVQNEPVALNNYPTCVWSGAEVRDFIRDDMGPTFREQKVQAELWLGTLNDGNVQDYAVPVMSDPQAAAFVTGVAYQWEGKAAIAETHRRWPHLKLMQSESECGRGNNSFADAEYTFSLIRRYLNGGASSYFYWNMVLQPNGRSTWGWVQNAMISVDPNAKAVTYHPEYYLMKHVSHFVRPGTRLVTTTGTWNERLAFVAEDGSIILVMGNTRNQEQVATVGTDRSGSVMRVTLPGHSLNTFVIAP